MLAKLQESYCFILSDAIGMACGWMKRTLCALLFDKRTLRNKLYAFLLIGCTLPLTFLEEDATMTAFVGMIAVPMFFARENWIY